MYECRIPAIVTRGEGNSLRGASTMSYRIAVLSVYAPLVMGKIVLERHLRACYTGTNPGTHDGQRCALKYGRGCSHGTRAYWPQEHTAAVFSCCLCINPMRTEKEPRGN